MNEELQLKLAREIWEDSKGRLDVIVYFERKLTPEEALALEELLRRGVIKRINVYNYKICPETKKFLDNGGKTLVLYANRIQNYQKPQDEFVYFS